MEPDAGLNSTTLESMTLAEMKSRMLNQPSHRGAPEFSSFLRLTHIPFYGSITVCVSIPSLIGI